MPRSKGYRLCKIIRLCKKLKDTFQTISIFFQNQNSAGFHNFDLFKWNHSAKKRKFHKKNRKTVYMLKKWALLRVSGGMRRIKVGIYCSYFWGLQFLYNFLPLQVVKTGGREKRTVLVTLTFSIFCGQRNFFRTKPHCLYISPFIRKPGVRNSDPCIFTLLK